MKSQSNDDDNAKTAHPPMITMVPEASDESNSTAQSGENVEIPAQDL